MVTELIGLTGYAQAGKDTTASILIEEYGFTRVAFADALRDALYALNPIVHVGQYWVGPDGEDTEVYEDRLRTLVDEQGWDKVKVEYPEVRALLQRMGTEVGRAQFGDNFWVERAFDKVNKVNGPVVLTDVRFPNEWDAIAAQGGLIWRVLRPGTGPVNGHISESALDDRLADVVIHNEDTIDQLRWTVTAEMDFG